VHLADGIVSDPVFALGLNLLGVAGVGAARRADSTRKQTRLALAGTK